MENVLFVASECVPFIKTGGLADVVGSLPQALKQNEQIETRVILPLYDEIADEWRSKMEYLTSFDVKLGWRNQEVSIFTLTHDQIIYYFIANDYYFTRKGIYGYYDDGERFVFFGQAVIEALAHLDFKPDILHAHDWQAGIAVALANILKPIDGMKTVFTIHNIKYQGLMPIDTFPDFFELEREHIGGMEWDGMLNCLKSALFHADKITTVSPTYAEEIKNPYYGEGLDPMLIEREQDLVGILNGIDTREYNPLTDPNLSVNYRSARAKKIENRIILQKKLGLPIEGNMPLYIIITRLVEQKGLHLVQTILEEFIQEDVQFIILGTGEPEFEHYFSDLANRYPNKVSALITFNEGLARQLYASADFFVMPSKFEPCGLAQLIALQYKTVPIVRETGGLKDTVIPYNELTGEGNGFSFANYNAHELLRVLRYSLAIYHYQTEWQQLLRNVNKSQFSWKDSAHDYSNLYEQLVPTPIYR
ncbi:glycogen synthase GlgA [Oceanobacillus zhaokaii]|uniref:Glycogen synthase n=1 Tax=Oceanobacillus zhaokaii TaxID=2052660 RepID=A0A345PCR3_9BACI|nr:glycogen synthase GlgA [Oceanobacillus zhaokaii]AXI07793.1 glycogen synthase GlgA [Oceanobacillus zhaokaii]